MYLHQQMYRRLNSLYNLHIYKNVCRPGWWNRCTESATGIVLTKVDRMSTPPEVERLRQKAKAVAWAADKQENAEQPCTGVFCVNLELSRELFIYYIMYVECHESNLAICVLAIIQDI